MKALRLVFKNQEYLGLAAVVSAVVFVLATWLPNLQLLWFVWSDASVALADKIILPIRLLGSITTNFTTISASYTVLIALLAGINVSLAVYLMRTRALSGGSALAGLSGIFTGTLGVGCAACGSVLLMSVVGTTAGIGLLGVLPLQGSEFGLIGVALLGYSTYLLAKQIRTPLVC